MNLNKFKIVITILIAYIFLSSMFGFLNVSKFFTGEIPRGKIIGAILVAINLFLMVCIFYCFYFIAKSLKAVEWQRPVTSNDYGVEFFLMWIYPIGIWILQPRINKIFEEKINNVSIDTFKKS